jgi:iron complex outermembrane receptor protein
MTASGSALLTLAFLGAAPVAPAQETSSNALDEIVVTAQKRVERLQDVPISVSELSSADLQRAGVTTTTDLPSSVSGLVWANQGAWIQPNLRGVYTSVASVGSQTPIAIYLDGVYQPMQAGTIADLPDVSRIEVLKGPQGTLFGRNATGGAISIFTLDPSFTPTGQFSLTAGDYSGGSSRSSGHYGGSAFFSGPLLDDTLAGSISGYYDTTDGYLTNDLTGARGGEITSGGVRGKLLWKFSDTVSFLLTGYYSHRKDEASEAAIPGNGLTTASFYPGAVLPTQPWHFTYDGPVPIADTEAEGASLKGTFEFDAGTLTSITGYSKTQVLVIVDGAGAYSPACEAVFACIDAVLPTSNYAVTQEFDFASKQMGPFRYVAGLFGFYNVPRELDSYNGVPTDETQMKNISYAAFAEGTYDLTNNLSGILGVRVNHDVLRADGSYLPAPPTQYADASWTSTTPRASIVYKLNPAINTYFTYSQGFKAGVVSGQYTPAPPASPEKISAYEVGIKAAQQNYSLNLATFYYDYRDLQVETFNAITLGNDLRNAAKAEIFGIDIDGAVKLWDAFELRLDTSYLPTAKYKSFTTAIANVPPIGPGGYTTINDYDASGMRMLVTPVLTGTLSGTYTHSFSAGKLEATASIYHSAEYRWEYTGSFNTDAYDLVNARLSFLQSATNLKYSLYGKNLGNKAYIDGSIPNKFTNTAFYSAPREIGLRLDYSF